MTDQMTEARALAESLDQIRGASYGGYTKMMLPLDVQECLRVAAARLRTLSGVSEDLAAWRELADHVRTGVPVFPGRYTDGRTRDVAAFIREHQDRAALSERHVAVALAAAEVMAVPELHEIACVGSYAPAEHALGLLKQALAGQSNSSAPAPESQSAFALRALVAAGHVEQKHVDGALSIARDAAPAPVVPAGCEDVEGACDCPLCEAHRAEENGHG